MKKTFAAVLGFVLLFAITTVAIHEVFSTRVIGALDFYPRWKGTQLWFSERVDPYSDEATEAIQLDMRSGVLSRPEQDQFLYVYPFYTSFLLLPLVIFGTSYAWVQAIWFATILFAGIGGVILTQRLIDWEQSPVMLAFMLFWAAGFYHTARTIFLGQFAGLVFFWLAGCLFALKHKRDGLAGILLALTTIKPQMSILIIPALLLWGAGRRRWRFVGGFAISLGLLMGAAFALLPSWLTSMIEQVTAYPGYTEVGSALWIITQLYLPFLGTPVQTLLIAFCLLYMLYTWRQLPQASFEQLLWLAGVTLLVTNLVVTRTATTNYMVLYIPLFLGLKKWVDRGWAGEMGVMAFFALATFGSWVLFLTTVQGDYENPVMYLPLPVLTALALLWTHRIWGSGIGDRGSETISQRPTASGQLP